MDISSLRERVSPTELSVSELNAYIKRMFDDDKTLRAITVKGEISNFTHHRSGHLYFSLKDEESQVKAVMFRSAAQTLKFAPENGMKVIVRCSVSVFSATGAYQLYVMNMQPDGIGALYLAYEQLKEKLYLEGLFSEERKRSVPRFPKKIGVITSPTGAAVRDIINVCGRRCPSVDVYLYPSLVQGDGAVDNLIEALLYFEASRLVDVIIIGRGGGSIEDLWAFNSEKLARVIADCSIPIISAVGHETDFTICDFVSDLRAPTPSAAAELAVPDVKELVLLADSLYNRAENALILKLRGFESRLEGIKSKGFIRNGEKMLDSYYDKLSSIYDKVLRDTSEKQKDSEAKLALISGKLNALSPLETLARGYSYTSKNGVTLKSVKQADIGDSLTVKLIDGELSCKVEGSLEKRAE